MAGLLQVLKGARSEAGDRGTKRRPAGSRRRLLLFYQHLNRLAHPHPGDSLANGKRIRMLDCLVLVFRAGCRWKGVSLLRKEVQMQTRGRQRCQLSVERKHVLSHNDDQNGLCRGV